MKFNYNPDFDIKMEFKLNRYPSSLKDSERVFVSHQKRAKNLAKYIEEQTGIKMNEKTFKELSTGEVLIESTISHVMHKQKIINFIDNNQDFIDGDCIKLNEELTCIYRVKNNVYNPKKLREDMQCIVEESKPTVRVHEQQSIPESDLVLEGFEDDADAIFIVESNGDYVVECFDLDVEEIYDNEADAIDEDDVTDHLEERLIMKKLIRGGRSIMKRKATRPGYKFSGGREVRMSSKEVRDRKLAQIKAARKRRSKMRTLQKSRKKSMGIRHRRIG